MKYEIQNKSDFLTGSSLVVKIPEKETDKHALYTIKSNCPEFILPFHYKNSDGYTELVYKVGTLCKLQYFSGSLSPKEYTGLWQSLLEPLLTCTDWFMKPCSFMLDTDYLYYDKNKKTVSYVYIPSTEGLSGYDAFYKMAIEISKLMTVSDAVLENKVLKAIVKDFSPQEFLVMLKNHIAKADKSNDENLNQYDKNEPEEKPELIAEESYTTRQSPEALTESEVNDTKILYKDTGDDIIIDIQPEIKAEKRTKEKESGGYRIFSSRSKKKKTLQQPSQEKDVKLSEADSKPADSRVTVINIDNQIEVNDTTQNISAISGKTGLRYIGNSQLPSIIHVQINEGEVYSIGRFDAAVGKKQSSFEFDKKTKAVSRRHAVVERNTHGYTILDLSSSAGTFVNDKKLPPNTPFELEAGFRVSFGNSGADYVWEVS